MGVSKSDGVPTPLTLVTNQVEKVGGLEHYVNELASRLVPHGFDVTIIAKRTTSGARRVEVRPDGVRVVRTWVPSKRLWSYAPAYAAGVPLVTQRELAGQPSGGIVHGHFFAPMLGPAWLGQDYIYTCHGPVYKELLDERQGAYALPHRTQQLAVALVRRAERRVITRARLVTALSDFMVGEIQELVRGEQPVRVLSGGVDTDRFSPGPTERPSWAADRFPLLLTARRLSAGKGVPELVRAMPDVLDSHRAAMLLIAGTGPEEARIRREIRDLGLEQSVRLLGDVGGDQLVRWIRGADLCIVPTQRPEPFGLSTVESLACGVPVMATPGGASRGLLEPIEPRLVFAGSTPAEMAAGIIAAAADPAMLDAVRRIARAHVHPRYSWGHVAGVWAQIYRSFRDSKTRSAR